MTSYDHIHFPFSAIESNLTCESEIARIRFKRSQLGVVDTSTVYLNRSLPDGCVFNFTTFDEIVEVEFPMDKCGGSYEGVS